MNFFNLLSYSLGVAICSVGLCAGFFAKSHTRLHLYRSIAQLGMMTENVDKQINVMVNGLPGLMALETAKACLDRGFNVLPVGFTGPKTAMDAYTVEGQSRQQVIKLVKGPGISSDAEEELRSLKASHPDLVVVDYTHFTAVLNNIICYGACDCDFVMGTTGVEQKEMEDAFSTGSNYAVIAPNMAKQIVAMQSGLLAMAQRFPGSFKDYKLTVTESHQSTKADTSGTAKAMVTYLAELNGKNFNTEDIVKIRDKEQQLAFNVPEESLSGHAFHTYRLTSSDDSVSFELQHNVCGRRIYAEGTTDAVLFLDTERSSRPSKRLYNMSDVLEKGSMC